MWVKICANTNLEDALRAAEFGADAVGFVFASSARQVTAAQVRDVTDLLPKTLEQVGVFTTHNLEDVAQTAKDAGLTAVQMHRGLDLQETERLSELLGKGISIIHVVHWTVGEDTDSAAEVRHQLRLLHNTGIEGRVLLDARIGSQFGGLGRTFDWTRAKAVLEEFPAVRVIVAGGLRPENVAEAVETLRPYGVDVASGVEQTPGRKDFGKLKAFIENARRA